MGEKKEYGEASSLLKSNIFLSPESWSIGDVLIKVKVHSPLYGLAGLRQPSRRELPHICIVRHSRRFGGFQQGLLVVVHGLLWSCNLPHLPLCQPPKWVDLSVFHVQTDFSSNTKVNWATARIIRKKQLTNLPQHCSIFPPVNPSITFFPKPFVSTQAKFLVRQVYAQHWINT